MDHDKLGKIPHHPPEETIERYLMRNCQPPEVEELEEHLLHCETCRVRLERAEEWVSLMKIALPMGPRKPRVAGGWKKPDWFGMPSHHLVLAACAVAWVVICVPLYLETQRLRKSDSSQTVMLAANRGGVDEAFAIASSGSPLVLKLPNADLSGPLEVVVVDEHGERVFAQTIQNVEDPVALPRKLHAGTYWVRANRAIDHQPLREFGLRIK